MLFAAPNQPLLVSTGVPLLTSLGSSGGGTTVPPPTTFSGPTPAAISGLSGWWDAGTASAWNAVVVSLADQSSNNRAMTPYHYYTASGVTLASLIATPRLNTLLGGLGAPIPQSTNSASPTYSPTLDADTGLQLPSLSFAPDTPWTRMLVWSRPNLRQGTYYVNANPVSLICSNGTVLLSLSTTGNTLKLFPTGAAVVLSSTMARRHTHAIIPSQHTWCGRRCVVGWRAGDECRGQPAADRRQRSNRTDARDGPARSRAALVP